MDEIVVCALYKFVKLVDYRELQKPLIDLLEANAIRGTLLLAPEGINGTVAGSREAIDLLLDSLRDDPRLADLDAKESLSDTMPFRRTKVKLKKEIVTLGVEGIDPNEVVGTYVQPEAWNDLISDPNVLLIDTRNDYEYQIGTFKNAINPNTDTFREFPTYVEQHLDPEKHKKVAMFCTGGIRCEKSTAYLKSLGFEEVYHLKGGILKYLEVVDEDETLWDGECFVFDERVTVNHQLEPGDSLRCDACGYPLSAEIEASPQFELGVSCPYCYDKTTPEQKARYRERARQVALAEARGEVHLGADAAEIAAARREAKRRAHQQNGQPAPKSHE